VEGFKGGKVTALLVVCRRLKQGSANAKNQIVSISAHFHCVVKSPFLSVHFKMKIKANFS